MRTTIVLVEVRDTTGRLVKAWTEEVEEGKPSPVYIAPTVRLLQ